MYSPPVFTTAFQRSGTFSIPRLKKSSWFGREDLVDPILKLSVDVQGYSAQIVGEREQKRW
jgi:hypothetical protein